MKLCYTTHTNTFFEPRNRHSRLHLLKYISFRAAMAVLLSPIIALVYGKRIINFFRNKQMGELVRDLGLKDKNKRRNPQWGGLIIILPPFTCFTIYQNYQCIYCFAVGFYGLDGRNRFYRRLFKENKKTKMV